ncbi:hypothetical protein AB1399_03035, partial [Hydrogenibacillus schlegelii]|uniref:hypothetical protein n=1 Tax=Hydrogenibacillus schlegelii TaxID=1484 RepID=UPI0034A002AA
RRPPKADAPEDRRHVPDIGRLVEGRPEAVRPEGFRDRRIGPDALDKRWPSFPRRQRVGLASKSRRT